MRKIKTHSTVRKTIYSGEDKKKIDAIYKKLTEAEWLGEDGDMCCRATTENGAKIKFKRRMREDVGEIEAEEMKLDEIGIGWLFLVDPSRKEDFEDSEWYVSWNGKELSDYEVFVFVN